MAIKQYAAYAGRHVFAPTGDTVPMFTVVHWGREDLHARNAHHQRPPGHHEAERAGWYAWTPPRDGLRGQEPRKLFSAYVIGPFTSSRKAYQAARAKLGV